jgi:hypothetical protein
MVPTHDNVSICVVVCGKCMNDALGKTMGSSVVAYFEPVGYTQLPWFLFSYTHALENYQCGHPPHNVLTLSLAEA